MWVGRGTTLREGSGGLILRGFAVGQSLPSVSNYRQNFPDPAFVQLAIIVPHGPAGKAEPSKKRNLRESLLQ